MAYRYSELGEQVYSDPDKAARIIKREAKKVAGQMSPLADALGVNRTTLYRWIEALDTQYAQNVRASIDEMREKVEAKERKAKLKALNTETRDALTNADGHIKAAAENLGVSENTMYTRIRQLEEAGFKIRVFAKKLRDKRETWRVYA